MIVVLVVEVDVVVDALTVKVKSLQLLASLDSPTWSIESAQALNVCVPVTVVHGFDVSVVVAPGFNGSCPPEVEGEPRETSSVRYDALLRSS